MFKSLTKFAIAFLLVGLVSGAQAAESIAVVDSAKLLNDLPDYQTARTKISQSREDLEKLAGELEKKLREDLQNSALSDAQKLEKQKQARDLVLAKKQQFDALSEKFEIDLQNKVTKAVEEEAKAQGLTLVITKGATIFGGKDITTQVLARLKK